jgi:hypothetical protein
MSELTNIISSARPEIRNRSLDEFCAAASLDALLSECRALEAFRRSSDNLYERVRALFFLYAIHRFHVPLKPGARSTAPIPFAGYEYLLKRRFEEAIETFLESQSAEGPSAAISSALASAYRGLGFQTLADQVRRSVRSVRGNQWMFRTGHAADYPLQVRPELLERPHPTAPFPILCEATPVRMDLTHSAWSDIFFLGMDFPEGARVLNVSIDLSVRGASDASPKPPVEAYFRVIDQPILRLVSVDLQASAEIRTVSEVFDFAKDYLGLLKAAVIASGLVPPAMEGAGQPLEHLLARLTGRPGHGIEIVSRVNDIPKGSRLAVSTSLLACLIAVCMRATKQIRALSGGLLESDRRLVAARAILGEWLAGSGGGWQDSGGVWPGMKLIQGVVAAEGDEEFGISRGRLLPSHHVFTLDEVSAETRQKLQDSLVLVHGGMAQDVGPILEMVTERYLLRSGPEWLARQEAIATLDRIVADLQAGDVQRLGAWTQRNFDYPIQTIIPWAGNLYTQTLIERARAAMGDNFWGFWMLGGMSGGGMGFIFRPGNKPAAQDLLQSIMSQTKRRLERSVPFAMEPVVYDFAINERGTQARLLSGDAAMLPPNYYPLMIPPLLRLPPHSLSAVQRAELGRFGLACRTSPELAGMVQTLFDHMVPRGGEDEGQQALRLDSLLREYGFDPAQHEQIQTDLRTGRIGLGQNRLPVSSRIEDVAPGDVLDSTAGLPERYSLLGMDALSAGLAAVVTFSGGVGSRWTKGAGVVKALNPFCRFGGRHRTFLEVHLAKSRRVSRLCGTPLAHVITTSYLTDGAIRSFLQAEDNYRYPGPVLFSPGRSIGLRLVPMTRDLRFAWEEMPQQMLDEQAQKVRDSLRSALLRWAEQSGEGSNYTANVPLQCVHPMGHWYEIPNLLRNGVLAHLLAERPQLKYLMAHNIDTLGADLNPALLGWHIEQGAALSTEVTPRNIEDRGGGLARIDGRVRLIEGLALPFEEIEFRLSYYNSATTWIDIDQLLRAFSLTREALADSARVTAAIRAFAQRMPTYVTLKDVKKRWGKGQEDVFPVTQFEKLWGDMTAIPELDSRFMVVPRQRGQQLKEPAQLDGWLRDGAAAYIESLCEWE